MCGCQLNEVESVHAIPTSCEVLECFGILRFVDTEILYFFSLSIEVFSCAHTSNKEGEANVL